MARDKLICWLEGCTVADIILIFQKTAYHLHTSPVSPSNQTTFVQLVGVEPSYTLKILTEASFQNVVWFEWSEPIVACLCSYVLSLWYTPMLLQIVFLEMSRGLEDTDTQCFCCFCDRRINLFGIYSWAARPRTKLYWLLFIHGSWHSCNTIGCNLAV